MDRRTLLLAYGIAEWQSALDHLHAMSDTIYIHAGTFSMLDLEKSFLVTEFYLYWEKATNDTAGRPDPMVWARRYLADHQTELATLLGEETHAETETTGAVGGNPSTAVNQTQLG